MYDFLAHYGTPRHSGRYPWGSGENPYQRNRNFYGKVQSLKKQGMTETQIAKSFEMSTTQLRAKVSNAKQDIMREEIVKARKLKAKGYSNVAIARVIGKPESTVRNYLDPEYTVKANRNQTLAESIKKEVDDHGYILVGKGAEHWLTNDVNGKVSEVRKKNALALLQEQGYELIPFKSQQMGTGFETNMLVIAPPGTKKSDLRANKDKIFVPTVYSEDGGKTVKSTQEPVVVDSKRVQVLHANDIRPDGTLSRDHDGMVELRRNVDDISMNKAKYCQVRIDVDGTHYIKGMAVYADDLPPGIDIRFNTNKPESMPIFGDHKDNSVLKPLKKGENEINPFGATILEDDRLILAQRHYVGKDGKEHQSALNIVSEEGSRAEWQNNIASQMLSKQMPKVAEKQLRLAADIQQERFDEINNLTNPVVRKMKLEEFADKCDSAAVDLKAAGFPRQANHYILSEPSLKENEIYAPNYNDGERVVLIRYPHAGRFEIPELVVNNKNENARKMIGANAPDAVCIHPKTAKILSGADFDGDSVLVIPNNDGKIKTRPPFEGLKNFDPEERYSVNTSPNGPNFHKMTKLETQREMGKITNLITDMTVREAPWEDIEKAVRHSMVVIDAEKHGYDYQQSYIDNGIADLKKRYQNDPDNPGKTKHTLLSRAGSDHIIPHRTEVRNTNSMTKDEYERYLSGEKIYKPTGKTLSLPDKKVRQAHELADKGYTAKQIAETMGITERRARGMLDKDIYTKVNATTTTTYMAEERDAYNLSTGTVIEDIYAAYANRMKDMGRRARVEARKAGSKDIYNPSAAKTYANEVRALRAELELTEKNKPLENRAQLLSSAHMRQWKMENPIDAMDKDKYKKEKQRSIVYYRDKVGAKKHVIDIESGRRWEAIQAGAIPKTTLERILSNANPEIVTKLSMPKESKVMTDARIARARAMAAKGYTNAQIAENLGVSTSTVSKAISS